jgi:L-lactate dehydrogenase complex protein LldG
LKTSKSKENILRKIRVALQEESLPQPFPEVDKVSVKSLYEPNPFDTKEEQFAAQFTKIGGHFIFCNTSEELATNLHVLAESRGWTEVLCAYKPIFNFLVNQKLNFIREFNPQNELAEACITDCEIAIARTGSLMLSSKQNYGRMSSIYYPVHIVVLQAHQIVKDIEDGLTVMKQKYNGMLPSMLNLNTGPSRTADIEKTLVTGVHGPKEVFCFYLNQ